MVIILDPNIHSDDKKHIRALLEQHGYAVKEIVGQQETIFGAVGAPVLDIHQVEALPGVSQVLPISKPYKLASRELSPLDTVVSVGPVKIGGGRLVMIAGPGAVESKQHILESALRVRDAGAVLLRAGVFKPRTSPYSFQGLGEEALEWIGEASQQSGLPVVSEVVSADQINQMAPYVDMLQIGARNMQNFELLKAVGASGKPVLLKRGMGARIEEWLMAAEYLMANGNESVVLCERGIRSFETYTRNSLDLSSIPVVKKLSHLPILVDPSHALGIRDKVVPMAMASIASGADGLMIEVHPDPDNARCDGPQSLYPEQFEKLVRDVQALSQVLSKELFRLPQTRGLGALQEPERPRPGDAITAAYQGAAGAYSEMALERYFSHLSEAVQTMPCSEFKNVFDAVLEGRAQYGVLPIENALTGSIHENYDLLLQFPDIRICGETRIRIQHSLIAPSGTKIDDIRQVYSHPQGLAQCARFLDGLPNVQRVPFYDTAGSVAHVASLDSGDAAAIANSRAARVYGLEVIREGIETNPVNYTRFVIIERDVADKSRTHTGAAWEGEKASLVFSVRDKPGALLKCMQALSQRDFNMTKIESRPIHGQPWEYMFYLDIEIVGKGREFAQALEDMNEYAKDVRVLGTYRKG